MANPSEGTAPTVDERLARHFLLRLRHATRKSAIEAALQAGLLYREHMEVDGYDIGVLKADAWPLSLSEAAVRRVLRRGQVPKVWSDIATVSDDGILTLIKDDPPEPDQDQESLPEGAGPLETDVDAVDVSMPIGPLLEKIFAAAESLRAPEVATLLLLAQAVPASGLTLREILAVLRLDQPIVAVHCAVAGFEEAFLDLLEAGMVLPGRITLSDGYELGRKRFPGPRRPRTDQRWQVLHFTGSHYDDTEVDQQTGRAAQSPFPIVAIAESSDRLPARLVRAAQLDLDCGMFTAEVVEGTIEAVLGRRPAESLEAHHYPLLDLADLAIAVRPGVSPEQAIEILRDLAENIAGDTASEGSGRKLSKPADAGKNSGKPAHNSRRGKTIGSGSQIIAPAQLTGDPEKDRFVLRIETLSGYCEAATWAMALRDDIPLWQEGRLAWQDMTAKLLLSGPPGTGKTTFAKALCNSLQIPLIATSVSTWLETGHLGDVLIRMNEAFAEAQAHRPAILFIDEIDGIGKRDRGRRDYDDYWVSVVNKALELLDGAFKSEGLVIVGATNYPAAIDPALLRSGRLETHIEIPLPDTNSLVGIFRHHLKDDLDAVVVSAPDEVKLGARRPPAKNGGGRSCRPRRRPPPERDRHVQRNLPEGPR